MYVRQSWYPHLEFMFPYITVYVILVYRLYPCTHMHDGCNVPNLIMLN